MNNLLVFPLNQNEKILISSQGLSLATVTLCSQLKVLFIGLDGQYTISDTVKGSDFSVLKEGLKSLFDKKVQSFSWKQLIFKFSKLEHCLVEIYFQDEILGYYIVDRSAIQSWITQLELFEVLMYENQEEEKLKGKSCCS